MRLKPTHYGFLLVYNIYSPNTYLYNMHVHQQGNHFNTQLHVVLGGKTTTVTMQYQQ